MLKSILNNPFIGGRGIGSYSRTKLYSEDGTNSREDGIMWYLANKKSRLPITKKETIDPSTTGTVAGKKDGC